MRLPCSSVSGRPNNFLYLSVTKTTYKSMAEKEPRKFLPEWLRIFLKFFVSKAFFLNIVLALLLISGIVWGLFEYLHGHTMHGESISVPTLKGWHMDKLDSITNEYNVRYKIVDSVYADDDMEKGVVLEQTPEPNELVKEQRTIYVTVNAMLPKMLSMPELKDKTSRQAASILDILGLKIKSIETEPNVCDKCVLKQLYKGKPIAAKDPIARGEYITLVVGQGKSADRVAIPRLTGLTIEVAKQRLNGSSLNLGAELYKDCATIDDSLSAVIYKQNPAFSNLGVIPLGSGVDVWLKVVVDTAVAPTNTNTGNEP
jgi:beta-lactam-binding protein with PASTA domain